MTNRPCHPGERKVSCSQSEAATLRDLITVVDTLCDELRQARLKRQEDIEALVELHQHPRGPMPKSRTVHEGAFHP